MPFGESELFENEWVFEGCYAVELDQAVFLGHCQHVVFVVDVGRDDVPVSVEIT